ncbi:MAG: RagB/SusD family nutrient uptake outer membrane protein [Flavobacterium sp. BFFFF1]|uniref:RagB/SusD family nutrient uptake outer membrane protein n=1 Tax=unclassified Flavobacterium TaxID=196869 RepID=UPI000BD679E3|nr:MULTISPECIES: RagB/SusD family nutrient uptake outer membrane protein [unclassified Flavobacterium]OYU80291.1 MAG: RagB/SusD family nutrient uptake outer membrane protein [Flavobacterium sp. BFFFF1]
MKKILLLMTSVVLLGSCNDDYLAIGKEDVLPTENFFQTSDDAVASVNAIYSNLRAWRLAAFAPMILSISTDDADKGSSTGDASFFTDIDLFTYTPSAFIINDYWSGQWFGINLTNQSITNIPGITMDEALKTRLIAEARFLRAHHYFNLVRTFGGVPIFDGLPSDKNYNKPRNTVQEVYDFIQADLQFAAENLPTSYGATDKGRATAGAAKAFLAKTYMYQENWAQTLALTNEVMGMGYDLLPDYNSVFRIANENSIESVFEVQATFVSGNCDLSNSQYSQTRGVRGQYGWGFDVPSDNLAASYEVGDLRRDATIIFRGETTPEGDFIQPDGDNPRYSQKSYVPSSQIGAGCSEGSEQNIRVMRFAEVLLMNAEAANETGNTTQALASLNRVRNRAGLPDFVSADQLAIKNAIWRERRSELAMEGDRFWDVVRQGRGAEVFGPKGFVAGKNELFPIPQESITLSNNVLVQNPNY